MACLWKGTYCGNYWALQLSRCYGDQAVGNIIMDPEGAKKFSMKQGSDT